MATNKFSLMVRGKARRLIDPSSRKRLRRKALRISSASGSTEREWSVVITDDDEVRRLNAEYRRIDKTTDVLSFPLDLPELPGVPQPLGEVIISCEQAARQAPDGDVEPELVRLMVHGICHLRGYDHHRARDRQAMAKEEARLLAAFELEAGLVARSEAG